MSGDDYFEDYGTLVHRLTLAEKRLRELRDALRPFLNCSFAWEVGGQVNPWITRAEWERAQAAMAERDG